MRFSSIVVVTTAICFAATTTTSVVRAVPIPAEDSPDPPRVFPKGAPTPNLSAVVPDSQGYAADGSKKPSPVLGNSKITLRRKKRDAPKTAGPIGTVLGTVTPVAGAATSPVTGMTTGPAKGATMAVTGVQSLPPAGPSDLDLAKKVAEVEANGQAIAGSGDAALGSGPPKKQP
ncbi:hypothetical protein BDB00DRAFT_929346 [Zychaea mexicana]|uniref:uncharacterized protein n=1 Tax=Zychaea mexicana TaxID=64656 RepID=UPI0022FE50AE|nr:uncharacterized protein BDB00DRAFT_929346 [Zychaea mexicana]KAI9492876.1 hypothetical protein BDB00DRAFT_929346 [Zychaea mexicana]